jgi:pimeloyl-ACP methyl ester carboxylesterase
VFVHGLLVNGDLWRKVVARLPEDVCAITPDWPMGAHSDPMDPDADVSPRGIARMVAEFIAALGFEDVTLVGNDTGGAVCQMVVADSPERIARLVLTNCDAYENFPPAPARPLQRCLAVPGFDRLMAAALAWRPSRRAIFRTLSKSPMSRKWTDAATKPLTRDAGVRGDMVKFARGASAADTLAAARSFPSFEKPVLIAWGTDDLYFGRKYAERFRADFPNARLEYIRNCRTFVPEDQPVRLAELITSFVRESPRETIGAVA